MYMYMYTLVRDIVLELCTYMYLEVVRRCLFEGQFQLFSDRGKILLYNYNSCGGTLLAEETYKIDNTVLADVLASEKPEIGKKKPDATKEDATKEEPMTNDKEITPTGDNEKEGVESDEGATRNDEEKEEVMEEEALELEEILRACADMQLTVDQTTEKGTRKVHVIMV